MLYAIKDKSPAITKVIRKQDGLYLYSDAGVHRIIPKTEKTVRVTYTVKEQFSEVVKPGVVYSEIFRDWTYEETASQVILLLPRLRLVVNKDTASYCYYNADGRLLLAENEKDSKILEEFPVYEMVDETATIEKIKTADGEKEVVRDALRTQAGVSFHTRLSLKFDDEALYGLGQHEEGFGNLRGQTVYVHQANRKIAVPVLVSTKGYGILTDTNSPMIFNDTPYGSYIYTESDCEMDFYFMNGESMDGVVREYRTLTGKAVLLPKWAFGYIQSQERYETQEEIESVAAEYRNKKIGLDGIVLDWCYWEGNLWGQKTMDAGRFPNPSRMIDNLHREHVHFMISIWPNMDEHCDNYREFKEKNLMLPGCSIYNALKKEARDLYWEQTKKGLACHGVDAWWCDNSEPFTPEWNHVRRPEPVTQYAEYVKATQTHLPAEYGNAFGLFHAQALYDGFRGYSDKRVTNLTRSSYTGGQRYGVILWSGDIAATWDTLRRQIAAGLHFCASGMPFWTVDIGAFFVKNGLFWYWKGDYDNGPKDPEYRELFVRWYQWGCFLPVFRGHGTDFSRLLWEFGNPGEKYYDALIRTNRMRYEWMPYIYSLAGRVYREDALMMKPLSFEYPDDEKVWSIMDQYFFGDSVMVCPIVKKQEGEKAVREIYLPKGNGWFDYYTNQYYHGGQTIVRETTIDEIPIYIREGSILPLTEFAPSVEELQDAIEIRVYAGKDAEFDLYEDAGDGYDYEKGIYTLTKIIWDNKSGKTTLTNVHGAERKGQYTVNVIQSGI